MILEQFISGREFAVGVLAGKALPVIEIIPKDGWFDYAHKYQDGFSSEICPADIDDETAKKMMDASELAARALSLDVYSRMYPGYPRRPGTSLRAADTSRKASA